MQNSTIIFATVVLALASSHPATAADSHPYYLHALSDLRSAYALIQNRPGDKEVTDREDLARNEIAAAIRDIRQGAIDDGRDLHDHPPIDAAADHSGALHEAVALLQNARADVNKEEDDRAAQGLQLRSEVHIDRALKATEQAISEVVEQR